MKDVQISNKTSVPAYTLMYLQMNRSGLESFEKERRFNANRTSVSTATGMSRSLANLNKL